MKATNWFIVALCLCTMEHHVDKWEHEGGAYRMLGLQLEDLQKVTKAGLQPIKAVIGTTL